MLRILLIGIAALLMGRLLLFVADRSWQIVSLILRLLVGIAAALMAFVGYGLFANEEGGPISFIIVGTILVALALHLLWRMIFSRSKSVRKQSMPAIATVPSTLGKDEWSRFLRDLGWLRRQRALNCRARIEQFLTEAGGHDHDCDHRELVIAVERRVPELLGEWERRSAMATVTERRSYSERTLAILESLASEADRARGEIRHRGDRTFDTLERYFSRFSRRDNGLS